MRVSGPGEVVWGLVVPLAGIALLGLLATRAAEPGAWLAFTGALPMFAAMFTRALLTGVVALSAVLVAGFVAASVYGTDFRDALPILIGVIAFSGAAVLVSQARAQPTRTRGDEPASLHPVGAPEDPNAVDALTGLPTREGATAALSAAPARSRVVALVDCDHLALLNDQYGRGVGDTFLFAVAGRTRYALDDADLVARWAGQQFLVVIEGGLESARTTLELVTDKVNRNPIRTDRGLIPATMSVGATTWVEGEELETVVARARQAMYRGKLAGGACLVVEE